MPQAGAASQWSRSWPKAPAALSAGWCVGGPCPGEEAGRLGTSGGLQGFGGTQGHSAHSVWRLVVNGLQEQSRGSGWGWVLSRPPPNKVLLASRLSNCSHPPAPHHSVPAAKGMYQQAGPSFLFVICHHFLFLNGHHELIVWPQIRPLILLSCGLGLREENGWEGLVILNECSSYPWRGGRGECQEPHPG